MRWIILAAIVAGGVLAAIGWAEEAKPTAGLPNPFFAMTLAPSSRIPRMT